MELTVHNLYNVLKDINFDERELVGKFGKSPTKSRMKFIDVVKEILDIFYEGYKTLKIPTAYKRLDKNHYAYGTSYSNDKFKFEHGYKVLKNVTVLNIESLYPTLIAKLTEYGDYNLIDHSEEDPFEEETWTDGNTDKLLWNIPEFSLLLKFILENEKDLINPYNEEEYENLKVKSIIQLIMGNTYDCITQEEFLKVNNAELIPYYVSDNLLNILIKEYKNNLIFFKPNSICFLDFEKVKEKIFEKLDSFKFTYETKKYNNLMFFGLSRYMFVDEIVETEGMSFLETLEKPKEEKKEKPKRTYGYDLPNFESSDDDNDSDWWKNTATKLKSTDSAIDFWDTEPGSYGSGDVGVAGSSGTSRHSSTSGNSDGVSSTSRVDANPPHQQTYTYSELEKALSEII